MVIGKEFFSCIPTSRHNALGSIVSLQDVPPKILSDMQINIVNNRKPRDLHPETA